MVTKWRLGAKHPRKGLTRVFVIRHILTSVSSETRNMETPSHLCNRLGIFEAHECGSRGDLGGKGGLLKGRVLISLRQRAVKKCRRSRNLTQIQCIYYRHTVVQRLQSCDNPRHLILKIETLPRTHSNSKSDSNCGLIVWLRTFLGCISLDYKLNSTLASFIQFKALLRRSCSFYSAINHVLSSHTAVSVQLHFKVQPLFHSSFTKDIFAY